MYQSNDQVRVSKELLGNKLTLSKIYKSNAKAKLIKPMDVTSIGNKIYITDAASSSINVFSKNGKYQFSFGKRGTNKEQFLYPYGITKYKKEIYVADFQGNKISVFNESGKFLRPFKLEGSRNIQTPGIIRIERDKIYISNITTGSIVISDLKGRNLTTIKYAKDRNDKISGPNGLAVDKKSGDIFISDSNNSRVLVYNENGEYLYKINSDGKRYNFQYPRGIAISKTKLYIVDALASKIIVTDLKGKYISEFGQMGNEDKNFVLPNGVYVENFKYVYVTDTQNHRVKQLN
jgi:DNA-binding beta-propeller fold protein YncE